MEEHGQAGVLDLEDEDDQYARLVVVMRALRRVFPYIYIEEIDRFAPLADELDLRPSDFVRVMAAITEQTGLTVPERDYPLVTTLDGLEQYLKSRVTSSA